MLSQKHTGVIEKVPISIYHIDQSNDIDSLQFNNEFSSLNCHQYDIIRNKIKSVFSIYTEAKCCKTMLVCGPVDKSTKKQIINTKWLVVLYSFEFTELNKPINGNEYMDITISINYHSTTSHLQIASASIHTKYPNPNRILDIFKISSNKLSKALANIALIYSDHNEIFYPKSPSQIILSDGIGISGDLKDYIIEYKYDGIRLIMAIERNLDGRIYTHSYTRHSLKLISPPVLFDLLDLVPMYFSLPCFVEFEAYIPDKPPSRVYANICCGNYTDMRFMLFNIVCPGKKLTYEQRYNRIEQMMDGAVSHVIGFASDLKLKTIDNIGDLCLGLHAPEGIEGVVLWNKKETHDDLGMLYKYKFRYKIIGRICGWDITSDRNGIVLTCIIDEINTTCTAKLVGSEDHIKRIIDLLNKENELPEYLTGNLPIIHYGITTDMQLRHPLIQVPSIEIIQ